MQKKDCPNLFIKYRGRIIIITLSLLCLLYLQNIKQAKAAEYVTSPILRAVKEGLSHIFGIFPFSVAEIIIYSLIIFLLFLLFYSVTIIIRVKNRFEVFIDTLATLLTAAAVIFVIFEALWGMFYYLPPLEEKWDLEVKEVTREEIMQVATEVVNDLNRNAKLVTRNSDGIFTPKYGYIGIMKNAYKGFESINEKLPLGEAYYSTPKQVMASELMSYTYTAGIFFPFTGEANINVNMPYTLMPVTVCHEMAHQRGIAKEDDTNFVGYIACLLQDDVTFRYSANLFAYIYLMNGIYSTDKELYRLISDSVNYMVMTDLNYYNEYLKKYQSAVSEASNAVNDQYLKSMGQEDGTKSYGRVTDLIIAWHLKNLREV